VPRMLSLRPRCPAGDVLHRGQSCSCTENMYHHPWVPHVGDCPRPSSLAHATELGEGGGGGFEISQALPGLKYKGYLGAQPRPQHSPLGVAVSPTSQEYRCPQLSPRPVTTETVHEVLMTRIHLPPCLQTQRPQDAREDALAPSGHGQAEAAEAHGPQRAKIPAPR